jgi:hypothetical protein
MPEALEDRLLAAAVRGDVGMVEYCLARGADLYCFGRGDYLPLREAIAGGHPACARLVLERGACILRHDWDAHRQAKELGASETASLIRDIKLGVDMFVQYIRAAYQTEVYLCCGRGGSLSGSRVPRTRWHRRQLPQVRAQRQPGQDRSAIGGVRRQGVAIV